MSDDIRIRWTKEHNLRVGHFDRYKVKWYGFRGWEICGPDERVWRAPALVLDGKIIESCCHFGKAVPKHKVKDYMREAIIAYVTALNNGATLYEEKWEWRGGRGQRRGGRGDDRDRTAGENDHAGDGR